MKAPEDLWGPLCGPYTYLRLLPALLQHVGLPGLPRPLGDRRKGAALLEDFLQSGDRVAVALGPPRSGKSALVAQWAARATGFHGMTFDPWRAVWVPASSAPSLPGFAQLLWERLWEAQEDLQGWAPPSDGALEGRDTLEELYGAPRHFDTVALYRKHLTSALTYHEVDPEFGGDRLLVVLDDLQAAGWQVSDVLDLQRRPARDVKVLLVHDEVPGRDARGWAEALQLRKPPALLWLG